MNCKKCGYQLAPGQIICSNCDTDNSKIYSNEILKASENVNEYIPDFSQNINNFYENQTDINYNDDSNFNKEQVVHKTNKKKNTVILFILLIVIVLGIIFIIWCNFGTSTKQENDLINTYMLLEKQVKQNITLGSVTTCDDDCNFVYDFDDNNYDFEVIDMGSYYKLEFKVEDDYIEDFKFSSDVCKKLKNAICNNSEIVGSVNKE